MTYTEFKNTYKKLIKYAPDVTSLYTDDPKKDITLVVTRYEKRGSRWIEVEKETEAINFVWYCNAVDPNASAFMRSLGGWEKTTKSYTKKGFIPVENISISPDRTAKIVRNYSF